MSEGGEARNHEAVEAILNRIIEAASRAGADGVLSAETVRVECLRATYALDAVRRSPKGEDPDGGFDSAAGETHSWPQSEDHDPCPDGRHEWGTSGDPTTRCVRCGVPWAVPSPVSGTEPDTAKLLAGIQWVRGMCSDEEPYEVIDAKLAELLDGGTEGLRVQAPGETPQPEDDVIVRWECPVCGWSIADESGVEGQPCEAWMQDDEDGEHGECRPVRYVRESALAPEHDAEKLVIARKALDECHEEIMRLEAERDAYRAALEEIRDSDSVDAALDPDRARRVARSVLAGESSTTEE